MLPDVVLWEMSYKSQSRRLTFCIYWINVLFWKCSGPVGGVGWVPNDRRVASSNTGSNCPHVESYAVPMALSRHHLWSCQLICLQWMPWVWGSWGQSSTGSNKKYSFSEVLFECLLFAGPASLDECKSCVRKGILCTGIDKLNTQIELLWWPQQGTAKRICCCCCGYQMQ